MQRFSYGKRDYAFGQAMLSLRTAIGLTQSGLAERLRVSRKALSRWEVDFELRCRGMAAW